MKKIITISREFGSGGRTIGKRTAEKLGIPCYDAELIQKIANESGFAEAYIREEGEYTSGSWLSAAFSNRSMGPTNQDKLWTIQYNIIQELAEKSSCVIVGRCADYVLRDKADCLKVFIHSDLEHRAAYYRFCTDMKWGRAQNYHVCLDSGELKNALRS